MFVLADRAEVAPVARHGWGQRLFAWMTAKGEHVADRYYTNYKRAPLGDLSGTVLEIGPGTGVNLPYYARGIHWIGVEPNVFMHDRIKDKARQLEMVAEVRTGVAEGLPVPDASVDAVVSTLVLCSVDDVAATLGEVLRVLKPGGQFVFIEHVAAPAGTGLRRFQQLARPVWQKLADGCAPDRELGVALAQAGFAYVDYERFRLPLPLPVVAPHIAGVAIKGFGWQQGRREHEKGVAVA